MKESPLENKTNRQETSWLEAKAALVRGKAVGGAGCQPLKDGAKGDRVGKRRPGVRPQGYTSRSLTLVLV